MLRHQWNKPLQGLRVLVAGCGTSDVSNLLSEKGAQVSSVDISSVAIDIMKARHPNLDFCVGDCTRLSEYFEEASFDLVVDKGTLDTLLFRTPRKDDIRKALVQAYVGGVKHVTKFTALFFVVSPRKVIKWDSKLRDEWRYHRHLLKSSVDGSRLVGSRDHAKAAYLHGFEKI